MDPISVYNFAGVQFGIRDDPKAPVLDGSEIHWLPPDSPWLAGLTVRSDRTLTLFDPAAGLGLPPTARGPGRYRIFSSNAVPGSALLAAERDRVAKVGPSPVEKLPPYLHSEPVDRFVRQNGKPIPLIHAEALLHRMARSEFRPPSAAFQLSAGNKPAAASRPPFLAVSFGGEAYAFPSAIVVRHGPVADVSTAPFKPAPDFLSGLCCDRSRAIPVIDPARRLAPDGRGKTERFLEVRCGDQHFRFLVETVGATFAGGDHPPVPLPALLRTAWRPAVLFDRSDGYPVIDPAQLLALPPHEPPPTINRRAYRVAPHFGDRFRKESLEVLEFDLGGRCHALPNMETEEPFPAEPVQPLRVSNPLVIGIAAKNGSLLPVLDPGVCFGLRRPGPDGFMIPVHNGEFEALVLTPKVYGSRRLPADRQHRLPFETGEDLVYGCYPRGDAVGLIFNAHALAENFDAARHVRLLTSFAAAGADSAAVPEPHHGDRGAVAETTAAVQFPGENADSSPPLRPPVEKPNRRAETASRPHGQVYADRPQVPGVSGRPKRSAARAESIRRFSDAVPAGEGADPGRAGRRVWLPAVDRFSRLPAEPPPPRSTEALPAAQRLAVPLPPPGVQITREAPKRLALPEPENRPKDQERPPQVRMTGQPPQGRWPEMPPMSPAMPALPNLRPVPAVPPVTGPTRDRTEADAAGRENRPATLPPEPCQVAEAEKSMEAPAPPRGNLPESAPSHARMAPDLEAGFQNDSSSISDRSPVRWRRIAVAAAAALPLLVGGLYYGDVSKPTVSKTIPLPPQEKALTDRTLQSESVFVDQEETPDSAAWETPADRPVQIRITGKGGQTIVYEVKPGDTLWDISRRYTGSGFNYPEVARENRIRNPDLIFPEQKIEVK